MLQNFILILLIASLPSILSQQLFFNFEKDFSLNSQQIIGRWRRSTTETNEEPTENIFILSEQSNNKNNFIEKKNVVTGSRKRPELFQAPTDRLSVVRSQFKLKLLRYSNPARRMQNLTTCACPQQDSSNCGRGNHSPCYFSFIIVASSLDQTINFRSTPFVVINDKGIIEASLEPEWGSEIQLDFSTKPRFIDIYAFNLGPVFSLLDGRIVSWSETVWPVDAWTIDLTNIFPHSFFDSSQLYEQRELFGRYDTNSNLNLEFSVKCIGDFIGSECDLNCKRNEADNEINTNQIDKPIINTIVTQPGWTICESALEQKRFFACRYHDSNKIQVDNCRFCEYGVINETICVHDPSQWKQEPETNLFYKSWAILLGVLLIVTMFLLVITCLLCWILILRRFSSKSRRESALAGTYRRGGAPYSISGNDCGAATRGKQKTLETSDWSKQTKPPTAIRQQQQQLKSLPEPSCFRTPELRTSVIMGATTTRSSSASQNWMAAAVGSVGEASGGGGGPIITQNSPDTSESDYRPSPFATPRREALV